MNKAKTSVLFVRVCKCARVHDFNMHHVYICSCVMDTSSVIKKKFLFCLLKEERNYFFFFY